eukprot:1550401-Pleurochrysis_carterae.AAC.1
MVVGVLRRKQAHMLPTYLFAYPALPCLCSSHLCLCSSLATVALLTYLSVYLPFTYLSSLFTYLSLDTVCHLCLCPYPAAAVTYLLLTRLLLLALFPLLPSVSLPILTESICIHVDSQSVVRACISAIIKVRLKS